GGAIGLVAIILTPRERRPAHAGRWLALFAAPFALFLGWRYWYFGALVPNTYYAKSGSDIVASGIRHLRMGTRYLFGAWTEQGAAIFAVVAVFGLSVRRHGTWLLLAALAAGVAFVLKAGWDWMGAGRFVAHLAPIWLILVAAGFEVVRQKALSRRYVLLAIIIGTGFYAYANWQIVEKEAVGRLCPFERVANVGRWYDGLADRLHLSDPSLATVDLGGTALCANMRMIDLAGLGNAEVARAVYEGRYGPEFFNEFLSAEQPTFIHIHSGWVGDSGIMTLPLIEDSYYEMDAPGHIEVRRHHLVHRDALTAHSFDADVVEEMVDGVELLDVARVDDEGSAALVLRWRATERLDEDTRYVWEVKDAEGRVAVSEALLYGLVSAEQVEVGRVHRQYLPLDASPADIEVRLTREPAPTAGE
ncbi:MAG: hypothetical protein ACOCX2_09495, partial [Armatimonadota bacterium]